MNFEWNLEPPRGLLLRTPRIREATWDQLIALLGSWSFIDDELRVWGVAFSDDLKIVSIGRFMFPVQVVRS